MSAKKLLDASEIDCNLIVVSMGQGIDMVAAVLVEPFLEGDGTADIIKLHDTTLGHAAIGRRQNATDALSGEWVSHMVLDDAYNEQGNEADQEMGAYMYMLVFAHESCSGV